MTVYKVTADPFAELALHVTWAVVSEVITAVTVGAPGAAKGVTLVDAEDMPYT